MKIDKYLEWLRNRPESGITIFALASGDSDITLPEFKQLARAIDTACPLRPGGIIPRGSDLNERGIQ